MRLLGIDHIDFFCSPKKRDVDCHILGDGIVCRPISPENLDDVLAFRTPNVRDSFADYLKNGREGLYAYKNDKVVGHAWIWRAEGGELNAAMGVDAPKPEVRKLFGWLPLPQAWDFLYFCRSISSKATEVLLIHCLCSVGKGKIVGISLPREDAVLRESVCRMGFVYSHTYTRIMLLGYTLFHLQTSVSRHREL